MSRHPNSDEQCPSEDKLSTDCLSLLSRDCASGNDAVQQEQLDRLVRTIILNLDEIGSFVSTLAAFFKNLAPNMLFAGSFLVAGTCSKQLNTDRACSL